jgi:glycosyltransferase involved in cell wall biosynthesis
MASPLVSVITPCYNSGRYLEDCILSVRAQDYPRVEHIIQDGGSDDGTLEILERYGAAVDWRSEPDKGQADGLDKAIKRSHGDILIVLNADDLLLPHAASWAVDRMRSNPEAAVVYGDLLIIDELGNESGLYLAPDYDFSGVFCVEKVIGAQAAFIRRSMFEQVGLGTDPALPTCPDFEIFVRLGMRFPMVHAPGFVARYRYYNRPMDGRVPRTVRRFVEAKSEIIGRVLNDSATPVDIRRLRRRAKAGLFLWAVQEARGMGNLRDAWEYLGRVAWMFTPADLPSLAAAYHAKSDSLPPYHPAPNAVRALRVAAGLMLSPLPVRKFINLAFRIRTLPEKAKSLLRRIARKLAPTASPLQFLSYREGSWKAPAPLCMEADSVGEIISVEAFASPGYWQLRAPPFRLRRWTRYILTLDWRIDQGGVEILIVDKKSRRLASGKGSGGIPDYAPVRIPFQSGSHSSVSLLFANSGESVPGAPRFSFRNITLWENSAAHLPDRPLAQRIASTCPEIFAGGLDELQTVNLLREWAYHTVKEAGLDALLENHIPRRLLSLSAGEIFEYYARNAGGGKCGLTGIALMRLYQSFGFPAFIVDMGNSGSPSTHVVTLVKIMSGEKPVLAVQDGYLNLTYADPDGAPLDYFRLLELLVNKRSDRIVVVEGESREGRALLFSDPRTARRNWLWDPDVDPSGCAVTESGWRIADVEPSLRRLIERWPADWRGFLRKQGLPEEIIYLYLFPFSIHNGIQPDARMLARARAIARTG